MTLDYYKILTELGYKLTDYGKEWRALPLYRPSGNATSLRIFKKDGGFQDFSAGKMGTFEDLVKLTTGIIKDEDLKNFLENPSYLSANSYEDIPIIKMPKTFDKELLVRLLPHHDYWVNRGVSLETLKLFKGGLATGGKMYQRYVFPIWNTQNQIIGFSGRTVLPIVKDTVPKWKHLGEKKHWVYPLFLNEKEISEYRWVILVESIGDLLALWDAGIKNVLVLFGVNEARGGVSQDIINTLIRFSINKIIIAMNNDEGNNMVGNNAAIKIKEKLDNVFDQNTNEICLPTKKDFGDMNKEEITSWRKNLKI